MKIQILSSATEIDREKPMRWHRLPILFEEMGHEVDYIFKQDWYEFYFRYLSFSPDIVITAGVGGFIPAALKKLGLMRKPLVHDWVDDYVDVMARNRSLSWTAFIQHFIIKNSDYVTTPSKYMARKCELWGMADRTFYIPHGINSDFYSKKPIKLPGKNKFLYIGSLSEYKQTDKIFDAVKGLNCILFVLGNSLGMEKSAPKNVIFLGLVKYTEVPKYIKAVDVMLLPCDDNSTLKMFEYLAAGKPILGLKGRPGYVLSHGENAWLVDDLRTGVKDLICNPELRKKLEEGAKRFKVKTWKEVAEDYMNFLEKEVLKK